MLTENNILSIAKDALRHFKLDCEIKFMSHRKFLETAKKSPLISQILDEGTDFDELKIPALIHHSEKEHIYLCKKILNGLLEHLPIKMEKAFMKSVLYHELFHIVYEHKVKKADFDDCMKSEKRVCDAFKAKYPKLHKIGYEVHKKATQL